MTHAEIISDLQSRGERNIRFMEDGIVISQHGKYTTNYWMVINNELKCVDCKTRYY